MDTGHGILLPTWLVKNRTVLLGGLSSLKLLYHVSECLGTLAATPADSHHRNRSSCSKVKLLEETRGQWPSDLLGNPCFQMRWRLQSKNPSPNVSSLIPHPTKPLSLSCIFIDVDISEKSQAQTLHPVAWLQGCLPYSLSRKTEPHRHSKCKGPKAWIRNRMAASGARISELGRTEG